MTDLLRARRCCRRSMIEDQLRHQAREGRPRFRWQLRPSGRADGAVADQRLSGQRLSVSACRPVEHPCWNFQPTFCLRPIQRAAKDGIISLVDGLMNANSVTKPRMMPIKDLAKNGPVGVLKRCCTIRSVG